MPSVPEKQKRKGHPVPFLSFSIPIPWRGSSQNIYICPQCEKGEIWKELIRSLMSVSPSPSFSGGHHRTSISTVLKGRYLVRRHPVSVVSQTIPILWRGSLNISLSTLLFKYLNCIIHLKEDIRHHQYIVAPSFWRSLSIAVLLQVGIRFCWLLIGGLPLPLFLSDITLDSIPHHTVGRVGISIHLL